MFFLSFLSLYQIPLPDRLSGLSYVCTHTRVSACLALGVAKTSHAEIRLSRPLFMLLYIRSKLMRRALNFHDIYTRTIVRCVQDLYAGCFVRSLAMRRKLGDVFMPKLVDLRVGVCQCRFIEPHVEWFCADFMILFSLEKRLVVRYIFSPSNLRCSQY